MVTARGRIRAEGAATAWQASSRLGGAVWRLASADRARSIDRIGPSLLVGVTFAPDGVVAAVTTGDAIAFVDTATLAPFARLDTPFVTIRWIR